MAAWRYLYEPGVTGLMLVVGLWCGFNLVIAGVGLGVVAERRQDERVRACRSAGRPWRRSGMGKDPFGSP